MASILLAIVISLITLCQLDASNGDTTDPFEFLATILPAHVPYFLSRRPDLRVNCVQSPACTFKDHVKSKLCWGYEANCTTESQYFTPTCQGSTKWPSAKNKQAQNRIFWEQADFGYVADRLKHAAFICTPEKENDSELLCVDHLRYCYARNIYFDFRHLNAKDNSNKYREDFILNGDVGGRCHVDRDLLRQRADHKSPLQSWAAELLPFKSYEDFAVNSDHCDVIIDKPAIAIKLDAGVSMYHHFCDFVNLYVSQHLNGSFHKNVQIVLWDTSGYPYNDVFRITWKAFSDLPLIQLRDLDGKKVCFREVMLPLLARMQFGLYYNMPLIDGCSGSGLFRAFCDHVLYRLGIERRPPLAHKIRVTVLSRGTQYRKVLNEDEIVGALKTIRDFEVQRVDYNYQMPFEQQLKITANTDIFMGMHGSGLTHMLFLPNWAAVFEIYNCEDTGCYYDLARLRGVGYFTWQRQDKVFPEDAGHHPTLGAHAKFTNYKFDVEEFLRIALEAAEHVSNHAEFRAARQAAANIELSRSRVDL